MSSNPFFCSKSILSTRRIAVLALFSALLACKTLQQRITLNLCLSSYLIWDSCVLNNKIFLQSIGRTTLCYWITEFRWLTFRGLLRYVAYVSLLGGMDVVLKFFKNLFLVSMPYLALLRFLSHFLYRAQRSLPKVPGDHESTKNWTWGSNTKHMLQHF